MKRYTEQQILLAGQIGEISMIDVRHLVSLLDEAVDLENSLLEAELIVETDKCVYCGKETQLEELEENSKYASYNCKLICNKCSDSIDASIDSEQQDKS